MTYKCSNRQMVVFPINAPAGPAGPTGATGPAPFQVFQSQAALATSITVSGVVAGHFLAVLCNNSNAITACSDGAGNTYTKACGAGPTDGTYGSLYISKITTGGNLTVTFAGTASYANIAVLEFAATLAGTVDVSGTATTPSAVVLTTTGANEVVITGIAFSHSANAATAGIAPVVMAIGINTSDANALGSFFASIAGRYSCNFSLNGTITDGIVLAAAIV